MKRGEKGVEFQCGAALSEESEVGTDAVAEE